MSCSEMNVVLPWGIGLALVLLGLPVLEKQTCFSNMEIT